MLKLYNQGVRAVRNPFVTLGLRLLHLVLRKEHWIDSEDPRRLALRLYRQGVLKHSDPEVNQRLQLWLTLSTKIKDLTKADRFKLLRYTLLAPTNRKERRRASAKSKRRGRKLGGAGRHAV